VTYAPAVPGKRFISALGCTLLITALAACGSTTDQTPPSGMSIAVITPNLEHDYFKSVQGDALDEGATQGVSITQVTDAADEVSQIKAIKSAAGLIVIELGGSPNPTGQANLVIGADDCTLGTAIGQWVPGQTQLVPGQHRAHHRADHADERPTRSHLPRHCLLAGHGNRNRRPEYAG